MENKENKNTKFAKWYDNALSFFTVLGTAVAFGIMIGGFFEAATESIKSYRNANQKTKMWQDARRVKPDAVQFKAAMKSMEKTR